MTDEFELLTGRMGWEDYCIARQRFLDRFSRRCQIEQRRPTMGLQEFVEAWNAHDPSAVAAQFTPDGVRHQFATPEARLSGRDAIEQGIGAILHSVPDAVLNVVSQSQGDDGRVTVEWIFRGSLQNDFPGLAANGAEVTLPGISVYALTPSGDISEERVYWDNATLMAAAGALG